MRHRNLFLFMLLLTVLSLLAACGGARPEPTPASTPPTEAQTTEPAAPPPAPEVEEPAAPPPEPGAAEPAAAAQVNTVETEANRDDVFTVRGDQREALPSPQQTTLAVGEGVDVGESGRAILRFADLLTVEVLRNGELVLQELSADEQSAFVTVLQNGGTLLNDFDPAEEIDRRLTVQTEFAVITATGTRFMVVREAGSPLEWIVALDAVEGDLEVTAEGITKGVTTDMARWIAPIGEPSAGISADMGNVQQWLSGLRDGQAQREFGEIVWSPADVVAETGNLTELPPPGEPFNLQNDAPGAVQLTLDPDGLFGNPTYSLEDCNGDGTNDIVIQAGRLLFDFRPVLARVRALDVTVLNRAEPGTGSVRVLDPGRTEMSNQPVEAGPGEGEIISLRAEEPYHYAELALTDGCFLGFSLTPPESPAEPGEPRPAVEDWEGQASAPGEQPFVRIDAPAGGADDIANGFVLRGESSVPFERQLAVVIETADGAVIQREPVYVEGGELGGEPGFFEQEITVEYDLPADIRLRVQQISAQDGSVITEDSVLLSPLLPAGGGSQGRSEPVERPPANGRMQAALLDPTAYDGGIEIDGSPQDWLVLDRTGSGTWTDLDTIVYDDGCGAFYPNAADNAPDLAGRVRFAYDDTFLYAAFQVVDEGYVAYAGDDQRFFRGDSPQLLLDLDLPGDFDQTKVNEDDVQLDLHPGIRAPGFQPRAALWQLQSLTARDFSEARVAAERTNNGYFLEAALPWKYLGFTPEAGARLGVAASVSDNDTPGTDVQECMVSSAPQRDWQNPATWGTLLLAEE